MSDNNFDKHIKDQIDGFQLDFDKSNWESLNTRLNEEFGEETTDVDDLSFDKEIADKLSYQEVPYNASHWAKLLERLELEDNLKNRLLSLRVMEVTAVLLFILAMWNWKGAEFIQKHQDNHAAKIPVASIIDTETIQDENPVAIAELIPSSSNESDNSLIETSKKEEPSNSSAVENKAVINEESAISNIAFEGNYEVNSFISESSSPSTLVSIDQNIQAISNATLVNPLSSKRKTDAFNTSVLEDTHQSSLNAQHREQAEIASFATIVNDQYVINSENHNLNEMLVLIDIEKPVNKMILTAGIIGSADAYLIRSPDDPFYEFPSYTTDSKGLTGGLTIAIRTKSAEIETGIMYSSVEYAPRLIEEKYSSLGKYYSTALEDILFNYVTIPINFKMHFNVTSNSSFYIQVGSSFNTIINSNFNITTTEIAAPLNPVADPFLNEPDVNRRPQVPGALEGGSLLDNTFITADLGIGFQQKVASKVNLFVQPTLQTNFSSGVGPNNDKLHKISLFAGAKYDLN